MVLSSEDENSLREWCLREKLGTFWDWEKPVLRYTVGPGDPNAYDIFDSELKALRAAINERLSHFSQPELMALKFPNTEKDEELVDGWRSSFSDQLNNLKRLLPRKAAVGFGHPFFRADFEYWGQMESLSLHEALLLSMGIEPSRIDQRRLRKLKDARDQLLPAYDYLVKRREQFIRFYPRGVEGFAHAGPRFLKSKFDEINLEVHPEFHAQLEKRIAASSKGQAKSVPNDFAAQERQTALRLIAAMACEQYGFNPTASRNEATTRIREDLAAVGLSLDNKTILKWLKEAGELVNKDYWHNG